MWRQINQQIRRWTQPAEDFYVRFWGVRGSIACPGPEARYYGGNTACLEIGCGGRMMIFDAGTGARYLGDDIEKRRQLSELDIFLTHFHYDHVAGMPFFLPFFSPGKKIRIWSGHLQGGLKTKESLESLMRAPLHPVTPMCFLADLETRDFKAGETLNPHDDVTVRTAPLNHPDGATAYRVDYGGRAICYVTDTEHDPAALDSNVVDLVRDADIMVYDCMYTDEEYRDRRGWGHSTWEEAVKIANAANVGRIVAFHHDPGHDDAFMDKIAADLARAHSGSLVAREGLVLRP